MLSASVTTIHEQQLCYGSSYAMAAAAMLRLEIEVKNRDSVEKVDRVL